MYAQMASINWMFVEGLFLHSRLTSNVFDSGAPFPLYYTIGWGEWPALVRLYRPWAGVEWNGWGGSVVIPVRRGWPGYLHFTK